MTQMTSAIAMGAGARQVIASSNAAVQLAAAANGASLKDLYKAGTNIAITRELEIAQHDELVRLEGIRLDWIDGIYTLQEIAKATVSSQHLNRDEDVTVMNRETLMRVRYSDTDMDFIFTAQEGEPLGLIIGTDQTTLRKAPIFVEDYSVLVAKVPEYGIYAGFAVDAVRKLYSFTGSEPI